MRRALVALALCGSLALAGCGGVPGGGDDGTVAPSEIEYPEHANESGITDGTAFFDAMASGIDGESFVANMSVDAPGGNLSWSASMERNAESGERTSRQVNEYGSLPAGNWSLQNVTLATYVDGETAYHVRIGGLTTGERRFSAVNTSPAGAGERLPAFQQSMAHYVSDTEFAVSHGVERGDTSLVVYDVVAFQFDEESPRYTNASGRLVVGEDGVVREYELAFPEPLPTNQQRVTFELAFETPQIERPDWVDRANGTTTTGGG